MHPGSRLAGLTVLFFIKSPTTAALVDASQLWKWGQIKAKACSTCKDVTLKFHISHQLLFCCPKLGHTAPHREDSGKDNLQMQAICPGEVHKNGKGEYSWQETIQHLCSWGSMGRGRCVQVHSCFVCILIQNFGYKQWGGGIVRVQANQQEKPQKFIGRRSRIGPHRDCHGRCFHTEGYTLKQLGYNLSMFLFCFMLFTFSSPSTDSLSFLLIYSCR